MPIAQIETMLARALPSSGSEPLNPAAPRMPSSFDRARDAFVLLGDGAGSRLDELQAAGVARLVVLARNAPQNRPGVRFALTASDALAFLLDFDPPPDQIVVERIPDGGFLEQDARDFSDAVRHRATNRATFASSGATWVRHCFQNLSQLGNFPSLDAYQNRLQGASAIVVSPGPSLAKNIGALRTARDKALIIAGNRALKPLREAHVTPHIVVVTDALNLRYQLEGGLLDGVSLLALDVVSHPDVVQLDAHSKVFYATSDETFNSGPCAICSSGRLRSGGSVATVAYSLAAFFGAERIALVGQDLALSGSNYYIESAPDGATQIQVDPGGRGTFENSSEELRRAMAEHGAVPLGKNSVQEFVEVPAWAGGTVVTSRQFATYREWFGSEARRLAPRIHSVNCTEGGALIDGMEQSTLSEFLDSLTPDPGLAERLSVPHEGRAKTEIRRKMLIYVERLLAALVETDAELKKCERLRKQAHQSAEALGRLDIAEKSLNRAVARVPFVVALESAEVESARREGVNARNLADSLAATGRLYRTIERAIGLSRPLLAHAKRDLKS